MNLYGMNFQYMVVMKKCIDCKCGVDLAQVRSSCNLVVEIWIDPGTLKQCCTKIP